MGYVAQLIDDGVEKPLWLDATPVSSEANILVLPDL